MSRLSFSDKAFNERDRVSHQLFSSDICAEILLFKSSHKNTEKWSVSEHMRTPIKGKIFGK
jgi:hypothetical protein